MTTLTQQQKLAHILAKCEEVIKSKIFSRLSDTQEITFAKIIKSQIEWIFSLYPSMLIDVNTLCEELSEKTITLWEQAYGEIREDGV